MFRETRAFSSFSVDDLKKAEKFYGTTLGLEVNLNPEGLAVNIAGGGLLFIYPKPNHAAAAFTVLNFSVSDIEKTVSELKAKGVGFEHYDMPGLKTDEDGICRAGTPLIAWFKDPAGNILSVLQEK